MTPKQRVEACLRREGPDRVPVWTWFHPAGRRRLAAFLELPDALVARALGDDVCQGVAGNNAALEPATAVPEGESLLDDWGIEWTRIDGFNQISRYPLAGAGAEQLLQYRLPFDRVDPPGCRRADFRRQRDWRTGHRHVEVASRGRMVGNVCDQQGRRERSAELAEADQIASGARVIRQHEALSA